MTALQAFLMPWRAARLIREQDGDINILITLVCDLAKRLPKGALP